MCDCDSTGSTGGVTTSSESSPSVVITSLLLSILQVLARDRLYFFSTIDHLPPSSTEINPDSSFNIRQSCVWAEDHTYGARCFIFVAVGSRTANSTYNATRTSTTSSEPMTSRLDAVFRRRILREKYLPRIRQRSPFRICRNTVRKILSLQLTRAPEEHSCVQLFTQRSSFHQAQRRQSTPAQATFMAWRTSHLGRLSSITQYSRRLRREPSDPK